jgi:hypothetical protein
MSPRGAALVFTVAGVSESRTLTISVEKPVTEGEKLVIVERQWALSEGEVGSVNEALRKALTDIHDIAGDDLELKPDKSDESVDRLLTLARRVRWGLFRDTSQQEIQAADRLRSLAALDPEVPPRVVEVSTPEGYGYPFELLAWHTADRDIRDPALRARAFLGMSAIIRRRLRWVDEWNGLQRIGHTKTLPITVFRSPDLKAAQEEADYLSDAQDVAKVYGPWPKRNDLKKIEELKKLAAVRHVLDSRSSLGGPGPADAAAVLHFSCHCNTTSNISDDHNINIGGGNHGIIELGDLKTYADDPDAMNSEKPRPLIFLNACGSTVPHLASRVSFPEFFLDRKSIGVVGPLCDISDEVAAHFSSVFYEALFKGRTIGEAVYDARWHLMDRHRNPLGLLYTFYGNPDLKVAFPREGGVTPACTPDRLARLLKARSG